MVAGESRSGGGWMRGCLEALIHALIVSSLSLASQGTNERGETGLFPFSYTTYEKELVLSSRAGNAIVGLPSNGAGLGIAGSANDHIGAGSGVQTPQGKGAENGKTGVMHSTMADIDEALTELQGENKGKSKDAGSREARVRTSFASERTADFDADAATEEGDGNESDEFERRAAARAALAVNAKKNLAASAEREAAEMERMRADAARHFEEEEARERALLEKERERKAAAAAGVLPSNDSAPKVAPIPGVAISDESDSEGSEGDLHDLDPKTHSPLFGQQQQQNEPQANKSITAASQPPAASEQLQTSNINADKVVEQPNTSLGQLVEKPSSGALLSPIPSSTNPSPEPTTSAPLTTTAPSETALAAGSLVAGGPLAAVTLSSPSDPQSQISQQQQQRAFDERSLSSSRGRGSLTADSTNGGTAATSIITSGMPGPETPKSQVNTGTLGPTPGPTSPAVSIGRPAGAPSDPHEWNVENVVEWGRMKGWDQATVLDKFIGELTAPCAVTQGFAVGCS